MLLTEGKADPNLVCVTSCTYGTEVHVGWALTAADLFSAGQLWPIVSVPLAGLAQSDVALRQVRATPLIVAARVGSVALCQRLVQAGAVVDW